MKRLTKLFFVVVLTAFLLVNYSTSAYAEDTNAFINEAVWKRSGSKSLFVFFYYPVLFHIMS